MITSGIQRVMSASKNTRLVFVFLFITGCGGSNGSSDQDSTNPTLPPAVENTERGLLSTNLTVDLEKRQATATIKITTDDSKAISLEIGDLDILSVESDVGFLHYEDVGDQLNIGIPKALTEFKIKYSYTPKEGLNGVREEGSTFIWPYFCGNIYPCKSTPNNGAILNLEFTGIPEGETVVHAKSTLTDAPSYMLAWAVGKYQYTLLGRTGAGTEVGTYASEAHANTMSEGTRNLVAAFDWLERNIGGYIFGDKVASVAVNWGPGALGGMEHHPLWHVSIDSLTDQVMHVHEAAHGWFGNGVRLACWEDFVLSEGTTSYLTARAIEETVGLHAGNAIWNSYRTRLGSDIAWPEGCNEIDVINDGLFSVAPYVKGALFYHSLEATIGRHAFDSALASFYALNRGKASGMNDLLDHFKKETGYDPKPCAIQWLRSAAIPSEEICQ